MPGSATADLGIAENCVIARNALPGITSKPRKRHSWVHVDALGSIGSKLARLR
jgi:hypothetical protein